MLTRPPLTTPPAAAFAGAIDALLGERPHESDVHHAAAIVALLARAERLLGGQPVAGTDEERAERAGDIRERAVRARDRAAQAREEAEQAPNPRLRDLHLREADVHERTADHQEDLAARQEEVAARERDGRAG